MIIIFIIVLLIVYFILILVTEKYNIYSNDDIIDMLILQEIYVNDDPPEYIGDYKFVEKTNTNIIYENEDHIKFMIRGTDILRIKINDIIIDIDAYLGVDYINQSDIYKNTIELLKKYKHKKIYLLGHSVGGLVANNILNKYKNNKEYNFIGNKMLSLFDGLEKIELYDNLVTLDFEYDIIPLLPSYKYEYLNTKTYTCPLPISMYDIFYNHLCLYHNNDRIRFVNKLNLIFTIIIFIVILFFYISK
jgi:hypothetical protein